MRRFIASFAAVAVLLAVVAVPVGAAKPKPPKPYITVIDALNESPGTLRYPADQYYNQPGGASVNALYFGSNWAKIVCRNEAGKVVGRSNPVWLMGEGGNQSVDLYVAFPYVPASYTFCRIKLLATGPDGQPTKKVLARDDYIVYSPV